MATTRETVIEFLNTNQALRDAGLPENAVYQADTLESPMEDEFLVVRWLKEQAGIGLMTRRPFDIWSYGQKGNFAKAEKFGAIALEQLATLGPIATDGGWLSLVETKNNGLGRGADMFDDGYDKPVIPFSALAVASGL